MVMLELELRELAGKAGEELLEGGEPIVEVVGRLGRRGSKLLELRLSCSSALA